MSNSILEQLLDEHDKRHISKAITIYRLIFTSTVLPSGAPILDKVTGETREGTTWRGYCLHLSPWRHNRYGDRARGKALCIGLLRET